MVDYQVKIAVPYSSGMQSNFSDLRFTYKYGTEKEIPYWMEDYTANSSATVWVKIQLLPKTSNTTLNLYYGNALAKSKSNGSEVFLFWEDFEGTALDTSKWNILVNQGTMEVLNGYLRLYRPAEGKSISIESVESFSGYLVIEYRQKILQSNYYYSSVYYGTSPNIASIGYSLYPNYESALYTGNSTFPPRCGTAALTDGDVITDPPVNKWFTEKFIVSSSYLKRVLNNVTEETATRYQGVSSGKIGFYTSSAFYYAMESHTDRVIVRKYSPIEPIAILGPEQSRNFYLTLSTDSASYSLGDTINLNIVVNRTSAFPQVTKFILELEDLDGIPDKLIETKVFTMPSKFYKKVTLKYTIPNSPFVSSGRYGFKADLIDPNDKSILASDVTYFEISDAISSKVQGII